MMMVTVHFAFAVAIMRERLPVWEKIDAQPLELNRVSDCASM